MRGADNRRGIVVIRAVGAGRQPVHSDLPLTDGRFIARLKLESDGQRLVRAGVEYSIQNATND